MDCARNIITANFGGGTSATTAPLWQWDYGQMLCITGIEDLPAAFEVHFSTNKTGGVSTVAVGADGQVTIPNGLLTIGKNLNAWIYLSDAQGEGETEYSITIPVKARPMPETYDAEVSGEFDDVVRQVSEYAQIAQTAADNAGASASAAATSASEAAASASVAESAKTAAETAQGKAEDAQAAAETAAQTATQKAQQTAQDAAQAALDAGRAESAAGRAEAAQTGAESAKTDAETAAQGAAASASAASASATSAGQSATAAAGSANAAAGSATTAGNAAQTATTKAGEASASASAAAASETAAQTAQTAAEAAKDTAAVNATTATTKAAEAAQSASNAAASETAAEAAATRAETAAASLIVDSALSDTSVNPVQNKVITEEITDVKSQIDAILDIETIPPKNAEDAFYSQHSENSFLVSNRVIPIGSRVVNVRIKCNSTRTGKIYLIDATSKQVLYIQTVDLTSGWNAVDINWTATSNCMIGFNGCYIDFRSGTAVTDDSLLFNDGVGLYEATPKTAALGDTLTITQTSQSGKYAFALTMVYIIGGVLASVPDDIDDLRDDIDDLRDEAVNRFVLDNGNLLRYVETNEQIGYLGRWWDYNGKKCTNADGSELYFKTNGATAATLTLGQITAQAITPYIAISIDGGAFVRQQIDNSVISLPDTGEHIVRVMMDGMAEKIQYQSDKWEKRLGVYVTSLTVDAGTITGILPVNKVGMFFGDSVTEGINALGTGANSSVNSASNAFPYFCTKVLNAVSYRVGYGGTGMTITSSFHPCIDAVDWDAYRIPTGRFDPDFIVINHGINDNGQNVSTETFIDAYKTVIDRLRVKYSSTPIFCVVPFRTTQPYSDAMQAMCALYSNCYFVSSDGWNGETTDGTHLSALGAKNNGEKLATEILKVLGSSFFINI